MIQGSFRLLLPYLICGLAVAACTTTVPPSPSTDAAAAAKVSQTGGAGEWRPAGSSPDQEVICTYETPTGTRFRRRYCATQAERDRRQQDDRDTFDKAQRKGAQVNPRPDDG